LAYSGVRTYLDYFVLWSQDPGLFTHFEAGASAIGSYVKERPPDERIYISPVPADHPSIGLYSGRRQGLKTYHGRFCLVLPWPVVRNTTYVIVTGEDRNSLNLLQAIFPQGEIVGTGPLHYGQPYFLAYGVPAGAEARVTPSHERQVNWDDKVQLWGFDLDDAAYRAGETVHVTLYYGAANEMTAEYTIFTHLLGPNNPAAGSPVWGQDDSEPCRGIYPTSVWEPGELVIDHFSLSIPPEAPAGAYQIEVGIYNWWTMERLPVLDAAGNVTGDHIILNQIRVTER
jgi:hypothetical protein